MGSVQPGNAQPGNARAGRAFADRFSPGLPPPVIAGHDSKLFTITQRERRGHNRGSRPGGRETK